MTHVLLFFIDGLGVGVDDPDRNPLATGEFETLTLTESKTPAADSIRPRMAWGIDASLGVPGLPQSATGQTAILTGVNAPAVLGHHASGFPGPTLRRVLFEHSILKRLRERGRSATFLNAFRPEYFEEPSAPRRLSATSLATLASGSRFRSWEDLLAGRAVTHDLTHRRLRERGYDLRLRPAEEAGAILAAETALGDFSLFEYFETDRAAHAQDRARADECLGDLDRALRTLLTSADLSRVTVIVASDHGNLEDLSVGTHTRNPAFFALWGPEEPPGGGAWPAPRSLTDLAPLVFRALGLEPDGATSGGG